MGTTPVSNLSEGTGITSTLSAVSASDTIANVTGRTFLVVDNQSGGNDTIGVAAQITTTTKQGFGNLTKGNISVVCPTGQQCVVGPFSKAYEDASGNVTVTHSATTNVKARAYVAPNLADIL